MTKSKISSPAKMESPAGNPTKVSKSPPTSAIKAGIKGSIKKDSSNKLFIQGSKGGIVTAYVQKSSAVEEAFLVYDFGLIRENEATAKELEVNEIVQRRGPDGLPLSQRRGAQHAWKQLLMIVGEDNNNEEYRKGLADKIITFLNRNAIEENYKWPRKTKFGGDLTLTPMAAMDSLLLDKDVFKVMKIAYPDNTVAELAGFPEICGNFFTTVDNNCFSVMRTWEESNSE
jgi:hypothetical protein